MMSPYPYTNENLYQKPQYYMYAPYQGVSFLESYKNSRRKSIEELFPDEAEIHCLTSRTIDECQRRFERSCSPLASSPKPRLELSGNLLHKEGRMDPRTDEIDTFRLLCQLELDWTAGVPGERGDTYYSLSGFIRKFEVQKRVYESYRSRFRGGSGRDDNFLLYALISFQCGRFYHLQGNLKMLNAQLKLNDLLVSIGESLEDPELRYIIVSSLLCELEAVEKMSGEKRRKQ